MDIAGTTTLPDLLALQAARQGGKEFLVYEDAAGDISRYTYAQFAGIVDRFANALVARGVAKGDRIALMVTNSPEFLQSWLAINQAGAVMVPVNVFYAADELRHLLVSSGAVGFVCEPRFVDVFTQVAEACANVRVRLLAKSNDRDAASNAGFELLGTALEQASAAHSVVRVEPDAPSQVVYTSGTTSRPKGAVISHRASVTQGVVNSQHFGMTANERCCVVLPLFHVNGQYCSVVPTLTVGGTLVLLEAYSATNYWSQVRRHDCTFMSIVPMLLRTMLAQPERADDGEHHLRLSFYALPTTDAEWDAFETRFKVTLVEGYGLSETLGICTANPWLHGPRKRHCIGLPVLGRQMRIVDEDFNELPPGQVGRIVVRGEPLFSGYLGDPEASRACMSDGWFDTGDNGSMDEDGYFYFFDRSKDVIKRAGENVAATEVERVLDEHPEIAESAVIGVPDPLRDEAVKAFVVLAPGASLDDAAIQAWCTARLSKFKVPTLIEYRASLPRTSIGKIMKHVLKAEDKRAREQNA
jgi:carnitine-CoA ligase